MLWKFLLLLPASLVFTIFMGLNWFGLAIAVFVASMVFAFRIVHEAGTRREKRIRMRVYWLVLLALSPLAANPDAAAGTEFVFASTHRAEVAPASCASIMLQDECEEQNNDEECLDCSSFEAARMWFDCSGCLLLNSVALAAIAAIKLAPHPAAKIVAAIAAIGAIYTGIEKCWDCHTHATGCGHEEWQDASRAIRRDLQDLARQIEDLIRSLGDPLDEQDICSPHQTYPCVPSQ